MFSELFQLLLVKATACETVQCSVDFGSQRRKHKQQDGEHMTFTCRFVCRVW